jgi:DNA mismatch repair protein MutS
LCLLAEHWPLVANYHITAVENTARDGAPVFSHRVQAGSSSRSFGIEVARMAGLPDAVIERAREVADALSGNADVEVQVPLRRRLPRSSADELQMSFLRSDV